MSYTVKCRTSFRFEFNIVSKCFNQAVKLRNKDCKVYASDPFSLQYSYDEGAGNCRKSKFPMIVWKLHKFSTDIIDIAL